MTKYKRIVGIQNFLILILVLNLGKNYGRPEICA